MSMEQVTLLVAMRKNFQKDLDTVRDNMKHELRGSDNYYRMEGIDAALTNVVGIIDGLIAAKSGGHHPLYPPVIRVTLEGQEH